jgi:large subunit ribosomal protein L21
MGPLQCASLQAQWSAPALCRRPALLLLARPWLSTAPRIVESRFPSVLFNSSQTQHMSTEIPSTSIQLSSSHLSPTLRPYHEPSQGLSTPTNSPLPQSILELLPLLRAQPSHYIVAHIHAKPYLLTAGDTLRLPFHMPKVKPGDVLRLNRVSSIGSRDYTMRGTPYVDERLFECRATVVGVEAEPMRFIEKTKRRNRRVKTVKSKHRFTLLKVGELRIKGLEEVGRDSTLEGTAEAAVS